MFNRSILFGLFMFSLTLLSCDTDKDKYTIPTSYNFDYVDYSEQTTRLNMLAALSDYAKSANAVGATTLDATVLKNMFTNTASPFADSSLNFSSKQLKDQTVSTEQSLMESIMDSLVVASASTNITNPANGIAGIMQNNDGTKAYLLNAKGVELAQVLEKSLMGACLYYQATAVCLGTDRMNEDNVVIITGQGTAMEHNWDEAFGYLGVPLDFPLNTNGLQFWGKYTNDRNTSIGNASTLMNAFLAGRAAISNADLGERDVKILAIRRQWELVVAASAVHYINSAIDNFSTDAAVKHHALSEAFAFVYGLKWGGDALMSSAEIDAVLTSLGGSSNPLEANFYNTTSANITAAKAALVNAFSSLAAVQDSL